MLKTPRTVCGLPGGLKESLDGESHPFGSDGHGLVGGSQHACRDLSCEGKMKRIQRAQGNRGEHAGHPLGQSPRALVWRFKRKSIAAWT